MKKAEERRYLDAFFELRPDVRVSEIVSSESPDFVCRVDDVEIGIEMTRFFFPSSGGQPPQAVDSYREKLVHNLQKGHAARRIAPLHVSVHFYSEKFLVRAERREFLVEALLDFVQRNILSLTAHTEFGYNDFPQSLHDAGVDRLSVWNLPKLTKPFWSVPYASFIPESRAELIQDIVNAKSTLVAEYRKRVSTLWLLIISGTGGLHSMVDYDQDVLTTRYTSAFDQAFIFRTFGPSIHELRKAD